MNTGCTLAAIDIGGTKTAVGLVRDGVVVARTTAPTPARDGGRAILGHAAGLLAALCTDTGLRPVGLGAGVPGIVDATGRVRSATDSLHGWDGTDVAATLTDLTGLPCRIANDVHAFVLGEAAYGAGAGRTDIVGITVGTGIGGGVVSGGHLVTGVSGAAGHVGHLPVPEAAGLACPCGGTGHVEAVAAGPAVTAAYRRRTTHQVTTMQQVVAAADNGDVDALAVLFDAGQALGTAIGALINTLDPQIVVVGGGAAVPAVLRAAAHAAAAAAMPVLADVPVVAATAADASLLGASVLAEQAHRS
ncbi:ROK family protein [Catellatospora sp. KI3]|uniref:ROK family protein n=1 Tax=Catellatospora sp. KI3 TaxID=3041620 RepID=UPI002482FEA5|nr:ROK family protein [Catellatospora sp. KI3]MDI1463455.1 ROK family protein [Catellatospora sp. KI3]